MDPEPLERLPLVELIVEERRCRSLSLADVAALVRKSAEDEGKQSGATRQTVHNWERGQIPRPDSLRWLACALDTSVTGHLALVEQLLARSSSDRPIELLRLGARYAEFSSWLHQDVGDVRAALLWADRAMEWAHEAGDPVMVSYVLARKSDQATGERDGARAIGLARAAQRKPGHLPARVQAVAIRDHPAVASLNRALAMPA
jgi:transcriptional regulator with XRE-family HTH domain